ncbi:hypothetical protein T484DRAFT_1748908, partial [Baffinella frigidus]
MPVCTFESPPPPVRPLGRASLNDARRRRSSSDDVEKCFDRLPGSGEINCPGICTERNPPTIRPSTNSHRTVELVTRSPHSPQKPQRPLPEPSIHCTPRAPHPSPRAAIRASSFPRSPWEPASPARPVKGSGAPPPSPEE